MTAPDVVPARRGGRLVGAWACAALCAAGALLYRPWDARPIGIRDYWEYAPLLRGAGDPLSRFLAVAGYYLEQHGRLNPTVYAATAVKWSVLGDSPVAWQWARIAMMGAVLALAYALLRRLACDRVGAAAGATLFVVAGTAAQSWFIMSVGEPLGCALLLAAAVLATGYRDAPRWGRRAALITVSCTLALLAKEMLACVLPLIVCLAACWTRDGRLAPPRLDRRTLTLVAALVAATLAVAAAVWLASRTGGRSAYVSPYALGNASAYKFARLFGAVMLPLWPTTPDESPPTLVGNLLFLALLWAGLRIPLVDPARRRDVLARIALALLTPVVGLLLYLPWPNFAGFYGLPMLVGPAMLVGWSATELAAAPVRRRAMLAAYAGSLLLAATLAQRAVRWSIADARLTDTLATVLAARAADRPPLFETRVVRPAVWDTKALTITRYASAIRGLTVPLGRDVPCRAQQEASGAGRDARAIVVGFSTDCGVLRGADLTLRETYPYVDWRRLRIGTDTVRVDVAGLGGRRVGAMR